MEIKKNKQRVVSTLFLYLLLIITACDFKAPEKWETPSWYLPLTIPLIDKEYDFCGLQQGNECYIDKNDNCIYDEGIDSISVTADCVLKTINNLSMNIIIKQDHTTTILINLLLTTKSIDCFINFT